MAEDFDFSKINASSEKLARTHESTIKHLIKSSKDEKSKAELVKNHIKLLKQELKINKDLKPKEIKAIEDEIKATKNATKTTKKFGQSMKDAGAGLIKSIGKMAIDTALAVPRTIMNFMDATSGVNDFTSATKEFAGTLGAPLHLLGKSIDFNANMFKTLSQQGAGFGKSVIALRNAAHDANMPLMQFMDIVQKNTQTFAALFGNVDNGMNSLVSFSKALREATKTELAEFGLNLEETSEFMMTQLEIERVRGAAENIQQGTLIRRTVEYAKQLTRLSKLTGISVLELDKQNRAAAVDGTFQATLAGMDKDQRDRTIAMSGALDKINPALGQMFKEMIAFGVPISDASKQLSVLSKGAIPDLMQSFKQGMASEDFLGALRESVSLDSPFAKALAQAGMLGMSGVNDALNAAAAIVGVASTNLEEILAIKDKDAGTLIGAKEDLDRLLSAFQKQSTNILAVALEELQVKDLLTKLGKLADETEKLPNFAEKSMGYLKDILATLRSEAEKAKEYVFGGEDGRNFYDNITPWMTANEKGLKAAEEIYGRTMDGRPMPDPGNPDALADLVDDDGNVMGLNKGTYGFRDFGRGTPAILHGREMVIPEANASKIVSDLIGSVKTMEGKGNISSALPNRQTMEGKGNIPNAPFNSAEFRELIGLYTKTLESNEKMNNSLNRLVMIGAMTEKNTKSTKNNLANLSGSLV
jgi:hypothetical protein